MKDVRDRDDDRERERDRDAGTNGTEVKSKYFDPQDNEHL